MRAIHKILVPNRGEIAIRIFVPVTNWAFVR